MVVDLNIPLEANRIDTGRFWALEPEQAHLIALR